MNASTTDVIGGVVAMCVIVAVVVWRRVQDGLARSRIAADRNTRRGSAAHRFDLRRLVAKVVPRRSERVGRVEPGAVATMLDQTARQCASGVSLGEAFTVAVNGSTLRYVFADATAALATGEAIDAALARIPLDQSDIALAAHVLRLCATQGGTVSESLDRAAATLRDREAVGNERVAQSAQARLSARVLTILPIAFGGWTLLTTPAVQHFFLTPIGLGCLLLGLGLNAGGWLLMRRVSRGPS